MVTEETRMNDIVYANLKKNILYKKKIIYDICYIYYVRFKIKEEVAY